MLGFYIDRIRKEYVKIVTVNLTPEVEDVEVGAPRQLELQDVYVIMQCVLLLLCCCPAAAIYLLVF